MSNKSRKLQDCTLEVFYVIEHSFTKASFTPANYLPCVGTNTQPFTTEVDYYNDPLYDECEKHKVGFIAGSCIKTGDSTQLVQNLETGLGSNGDYSYICNSEFVITHDHKNQLYKSKNSIMTQGSLYWDNNINNGIIAVPSKWAIIGGTGKYKNAFGTVTVKELGCLPIDPHDQNSTLISKYSYKLKIYIPNC